MSNVSRVAQLDLRYITPLGSSGNGGEIPGTKAGAGNENGINKKKRPDEARSDQSEKMPVNRQREPKENAVAEEKTQEAIEKRETAFDQLVLPEGHREIILSLIAQHFQDKTSKNAENEETDIVRGKGIRSCCVASPIHVCASQLLTAIDLTQAKA